MDQAWTWERQMDLDYKSGPSPAHSPPVNASCIEFASQELIAVNHGKITRGAAHERIRCTKMVNHSGISEQEEYFLASIYNFWMLEQRNKLCWQWPTKMPENLAVLWAWKWSLMRTTSQVWWLSNFYKQAIEWFIYEHGPMSKRNEKNT